MKLALHYHGESGLLGLGLEAFGLIQSQGQSDQYSFKHSVSRYNYTYSTLVYQRHWYRHSAITI